MAWDDATVSDLHSHVDAWIRSVEPVSSRKLVRVNLDQSIDVGRVGGKRLVLRAHLVQSEPHNQRMVGGVILARDGDVVQEAVLPCKCQLQELCISRVDFGAAEHLV